MKNAGSRRHFFLVWLFAHRGVDGYAVHAFNRPMHPTVISALPDAWTAK